ncbi:hypothetical protein CAPTEDRAFT_204254 [Capitella teleta]|uniref:Uncharacterized protein n=1 Tax=Capitella teleta TaxID=283909 RepID=R7VFR3_CAPTE|nr:hypothetical protein CAPTEDRAFT_204254 [Capitella teleta]|eukprot:ELU17663.1 hypothetical protein CAPTEDRAFT_204254 [Capitella teleta]
MGEGRGAGSDQNGTHTTKGGGHGDKTARTHRHRAGRGTSRRHHDEPVELASKQDCLKSMKDFNRETARYCCLIPAIGSTVDSISLRNELKSTWKKAHELANQNKSRLLPHLKGRLCKIDEVEEYEKIWTTFGSCLENLQSQMWRTVSLLACFPLHGVVISVYAIPAAAVAMWKYALWSPFSASLFRGSFDSRRSHRALFSVNVLKFPEVVGCETHIGLRHVFKPYRTIAQGRIDNRNNGLCIMQKLRLIIKGSSLKPTPREPIPLIRTGQIEAIPSHRCFGTAQTAGHSLVAVEPIDSANIDEHETTDWHILQQDICDISTMLVEIQEIVDVKPWTIEPEIDTAKIIERTSSLHSDELSEDGHRDPATTSDMVSVFNVMQHRRKKCLCLVLLLVCGLIAFATVLGVCIGFL